MGFSFQVKKQDKKFRARTGVISTPNGEINTPAFSPVATRATVKALSVEDLKSAKSQVVLANTYHLYLKPGVDVIRSFGGFAPFMKWEGPTITDSGGYQVSFLWTPKNKENDSGGKVAKITDEGALFVSHIDGTRHLLTPEKSMDIQQALGADIIMAFDQPLASDATDKRKREAFKRTMLWEERSLKAWRDNESKRKSGTYQALFGIVQGDIDKNLRRESLKFLTELDFPGLAMGGESVGKDPHLTAESLDAVADLLPDNKPLHALGLGGGPEGIFEAVQRGADTFDNTSITRQARAGLLFIYPEDGGSKTNKFRADIKSKKHISQKEPLSRVCSCYSCQSYSAAYIHHLIVSGELLGLRLATIHNVHYINSLMERIRDAIESNAFLELKEEWLGR